MSATLLSRKRLVVLGLDGMPLSLARRLGEAGVMPNLGRLAQDPRAATIEAELPELSPVNWTSFWTAEGPGTHGVFGFTRIDPDSYRLSVVDSTAVACPSIFDRLGARGVSMKVLNLPNTYPARPLRGTLVAGFVAHELSRAVFPPPLAHMLARAGYVLEAETEHAAHDPHMLLAELRRALASRRRAFELLWADMAWDLFVFVITETDRLFHFLMEAVLDARHALHGPCMEFLAEVDALAGEVLARHDALPGEKRLIALADHGFTLLRTEVDLNAWLASRGLLRLAPPRAAGTDAQWEAARILPESAAFALDPGRIYLHTAGRFARGGLTSAQAARLADEIAAALMELRFEGEPVLAAVHRGRELYAGPEAWRAPDLVCEARPGFDLKAKFDRDEIFGRYHRTGSHTVHGALWYDSGGSRPARMRDAGREVLAYYGLDGQ